MEETALLPSHRRGDTTGSSWILRLSPRAARPVPESASSPDLLVEVTARVGSPAVGWAVQLGEDMAAAVARSMPVFGESPGAVRTLRSATESVTLTTLMLLSAGGDVPGVTQDAIGATTEFVRRRIPVEMMLRGIQLAHGVMSDAFLAACQDLTEEPQRTAEMRRTTSALFGWYAEFSRLTAEHYHRQLIEWTKSADAARSDLVNSLLAGRTIDPGRAERELRYAITGRHVGVVVGTTGSSAAEIRTLERVAHDVLRSLGYDRQLIVAATDREVWAWGEVLAGVAEPDSDLPAVPDGLVVGIGNPADGPAGFRTTHAEAETTTRLAPLEAAYRRILRYQDASLVAMLAGKPEDARRFVRFELGGLARDTPAAAALRETLLAYLDEQSSPAAAAAKLHVARNTVSYRVARAIEILGRDPATRRLQLHVALHLAHFLGRDVLLGDDAQR